MGAINWFALFEAIGVLVHQLRLLLEIRPKEVIQRAARWLAGQGLAP